LRALDDRQRDNAPYLPRARFRRRRFGAPATEGGRRAFVPGSFEIIELAR